VFPRLQRMTAAGPPPPGWTTDPPAPAPGPQPPPAPPRDRLQVIATLVGGVTVMGAGVALLLLGEHPAGLALIAAAAAELGVKAVALTR
jgi:hypothetical protein